MNLNLENKEITEDSILVYETLKENIELKHTIACLKARCRNLSQRNLILETENADLKFCQKMFWTNQKNAELDSFLTAKAQEDVRV